MTLSTCTWIKVLQEELRLLQEQAQTSVADEVNAAPPTEVNAIKLIFVTLNANQEMCCYHYILLRSCQVVCSIKFSSGDFVATLEGIFLCYICFLGCSFVLKKQK